MENDLAFCPICGKTVDWETSQYGIFCSAECAEKFRQEFDALVNSLETELPAEQN